MGLLEQLAAGLLGYAKSEPEGLLARGLRQPAGLLGRGLNSLDRGLSYTPPEGLLADQQRFFNPSVMDTVADRAAFVQNVATGPLGIAPMGWTAYHGSPHKFDKFSMDKIGTGEGAQAYGHGLYFAEHPSVAREYMKVDPAALPTPRRAFLGQELESGTPQYHAATLLSSPGRSLASVRKEVQGWINNARPGEDVSHYQGVLDTLNRATSKADFKELPPKSYLYKVDISDTRAPKEAFLQWDLPLSQQSESVRDAVTGVVNKHIQNAFIEGVNGNTLEAAAHWNPWLRQWLKDPSKATGEDIHKILGSGAYPGFAGTKAAAAKTLREAGIPGIRYLDAGSRGTGGTYNTVLFDDSLVKILARE